MEDSIIDTYCQLLDGHIRRMPVGAWRDIENAYAVMRYLALERYGVPKEEIPFMFTMRFLEGHKLRGMYTIWSKSKSINDLIVEAFPEYSYEPWDLPICPYEVWFDPNVVQRAEAFLKDKYGDDVPEEAYERHGMAGLLHKKKTRT